MFVYVIWFFFFFQAEDGIRDHCVTGVQTCALPIFRAEYRPSGEYLGSRSVFGPKVMTRVSPVTDSVRQMRVGGSPSSLSMIVPLKTTRRPSGETSSSAASLICPVPGWRTAR